MTLRRLPQGARHTPRISLTRAISKLGFCSRTKAQGYIMEGRVRVNGSISRDSENRVELNLDRIEIDDLPISPGKKVYLMLNKPRGLVVTTSDEKGRDTVYACLRQERLPWIAPVGRLDKASEGLLLFTNDTRWAARILDPETHLEKAYHVQINKFADEELIRQMMKGVTTEEGDFLAAKKARVLRRGSRNCWLEIILDEGKNRHLRRLLTALGLEVLRLVRVAIGPLTLGKLPKGTYRHLSKEEIDELNSFPKRSNP